MIRITFEETRHYNTIVDEECCIEMRHAINGKTMITAGTVDKPHLELEIGRSEAGMSEYDHPVTICPFCGVKVTIHSSVKEAS